jgi:putative protein-disulfide isomerase
LHSKDVTDAVPGAPPSFTQLGTQAALVTIDYFTDPLCSWSWAFEAQWRRLRYEFGGQLTWRYRMGGMLADWQSFSDPLNSVANPAQMGPQWHQVRALTGMPFDERIWREDPPASSYPASLAFKAAELQGPGRAERYLRRLREAVMLERRNIARQDVLLALAAEASSQSREPVTLDAARFANDLDGIAALEAFREDIKTAQYRGIGRFPTLILQRVGGRGVIIVGYRPYAVLCEALAAVAPDLAPVRRARDAAGYTRHWGSATVPEVAEALGVPVEEAAHQLAAAADRGDLIVVGPRPATRRYCTPASP